MSILSTSSAVFACYAKACAPPPAGKGGSSKGGPSGRSAGTRTSGKGKASTSEGPVRGPRPPEATLRKTWSDLRRKRLKENPNDTIYEVSPSWKGPKKFQNKSTASLYDYGAPGGAEARRRTDLEDAVGVYLWD